MTKVKVFVYGRRRWRRGYDNSSPDFRHRGLIKYKIHVTTWHKAYVTCINVLIRFLFEVANCDIWTDVQQYEQQKEDLKFKAADIDTATNVYLSNRKI